MIILLFGASCAFLVSCLMMPIMVFISNYLGAVSDVGGRHVGQVPIGRLGGGAVLAGLVLSILVVTNFESSIKSEVNLYFRNIIGIVIGTAMVAFIGFWDDCSRVDARWKIGVHIAAAFVAFKMGLQIDIVDLPYLKPIHLGVFKYLVTFLWIVGIVNAVNLIDGLDGLAGGVVFFAAVVNLVSAVSIGAVFPAILMAAVAGGILGFLFFNWHPAKIYLGDGGAYSLGFILATNSLLAPFQKASTGIALMVPILAAGLPITDTFVTMFRRVLNRRGIFSADRGHLHHVLLDAGISHRKVVVGLYIFSCLLGSIALIIVFKRRLDVGIVLFLASAVGSIVWSVSVRKQLARIWVRVSKFE